MKEAQLLLASWCRLIAKAARNPIQSFYSCVDFLSLILSYRSPSVFTSRRSMLSHRKRSLHCIKGQFIINDHRLPQVGLPFVSNNLNLGLTADLLISVQRHLWPIHFHHFDYNLKINLP